MTPSPEGALDFVLIISNEVANGTLGDSLMTVGGIGIAISAGVLALVKGWALVRSIM